MADVVVVIYVVLEIANAVACCLGNVMVIWAVWSCGALKQPTFCFVVSLAVADFLVGAVAVPLDLMIDSWLSTTFYSCLFITCIVLVLSQASVLLLLAIAVDRYLRVWIPIRYKRTATRKPSWAVVVLCWIAACLMGFTPLLGWYNQETYQQLTNSTTIKCNFLSVVPVSYLVNFMFYFGFLVPLFIMAGLYLNIFLIIRRQLRERVGKAPESNTYYHKEQKLAGSLALVLALFLICWLPLHILHVITYYWKGSNISRNIFYVGIFLSHANSAVNPIVYAFKIPKIRAAYKRIWKRLFLCAEDRESQREQSSQSADNIISSNNTLSTTRSANRVIHSIDAAEK